MKLAAALVGVFLLFGCSATAAPPAPSGVSPSPASTTPSPAKSAAPTRTYTADESALIEADGRSLSDSNLQEFLDAAHGLCTEFVDIDDDVIFTSIMKETEEKRMTVGRIMLLLCKEPRFTALVASLSVPGALASGTYYVGTGADQIAPGSYKTIGPVTNCYWVRKDKNGSIIKNDLVENAPGGVQLTVKATDYEVTMSRCGVWVPAK